MLEITLVIPGLLSSLEGLAPDPEPRFPALELLLARAGRRAPEHTSPLRLQCRQFGLDPRPGTDLPVAAITRLIDESGRPEGIWMRADPVHVSVSMTGMTLMDPQLLSLTRHEAVILGAPLQVLFADYKLEFQVPEPDRWYLRLPRLPGVETRPLPDAVGAPVRSFLAGGSDGIPWETILTEAQMLLHDSEINRERERDGRMTVNSLWFWGAGDLPVLPPCRWTGVYAGDPLVRGLARLAQLPCEEVPRAVACLLAPGTPRRLLVNMEPLPRYALRRDYGAWEDTVRHLEVDWFAPLLEALRTGILSRLRISTDSRCYTLTGWSLRRFWRRPVSLPALSRGLHP